jgi:hypothetical protein
MISEVQDVNFIVENFDSGELDCNITETEVSGYSANYFDGTVDSADGCEYTDLEFGQNQCVITNTPEPVTVDVEKVWIIDGPGGDSVELWCLEMEGYGSELFTPEVIPNYPNSLCLVWETVYDSGVEVNNGCAPPPDGSGELLVVSAGVGDSCVIINTFFFEGIPTLSQYGHAILALLMLGVGFVGFRRFS